MEQNDKSLPVSDIETNRSCVLVSFNCKNVSRSVNCITSLCESADVVALQETWLMPHDLPFLGTIDAEFSYTGTSAIDTSAGPLRGRPYGGVALLWRRSAFDVVSVVKCNSARLCAIKIISGARSFLVFSIYMPTNESDNLPEFIECLGELSALIDNSNVNSAFMLGDFNAHPNKLFCNELLSFCSEQKWICADLNLLKNDSYTYISDINGCNSWLDHCVVTEAAMLSVTKVNVLYGTYWSDHFPLQVECDINILQSKSEVKIETNNNVIWGIRDECQINSFKNNCHNLLKQIDFPEELQNCSDGMCNDLNHKHIIDKMYNDIVSILCDSAKLSNRIINRKRKIVGWNKHVKQAHCVARRHFRLWVLYGRPSCGEWYERMTESRRVFKSKLKWCQKNRAKIQLDILASHHVNKDFNKFWKQVKKFNYKQNFPDKVEGSNEPQLIANLFKEHFKVEPPPSGSCVVGMLGAENSDCSVIITGNNVNKIIRTMTRGKSPGHDGLSIEHLQHAGTHLPRVLAMFFNCCIRHSYIPEPMLRTVVVPLIKNKTGDSSDISNYRPISLATIISKVLDSLLDKMLESHLTINDAQFGFRAGLSTETAVLCLKQTVQYYTKRSTPVYACFLDLSKAFDLVPYEILWQKLCNETDLPAEVTKLFKYWYENQTNSVRWAGSYSDVYKLESGVRQGGITSPKLFNLYINRLIERLSSTSTGCSIDGVSVNNISYADDMVLLGPSIDAIKKLLAICEEYAVKHGLRYNAKKSELLVFQPGGPHKITEVPQVLLCKAPLKRVSKFKYLGHWVNDSLTDNEDIDRERRALSVRANMLASKFAQCTAHVKRSLFKAYCQAFYTCSLWTTYTKAALNRIRVQYNNAFRMLMGLPRHCSASGMFTEATTDSFYAILRKRSASLMRRVRGSSNSILNALSDRPDCPIWQHWMSAHLSLAMYDV